MRPDKILFIDTETGGLDPVKNSLLSVALVVWQDFRIIDKTEILINDNILNVTSQALKINQINLEQHKQNALQPAEALKIIDSFFSNHFHEEEKITLGGHNINFDINFFKHFLLSNNYNWSKRFSHRHVDTATILYYLYLAGRLKQKAISSQEAFDLFGISVSHRHTALADAVATAELFTKLILLMYKGSKNKKEDINFPNLF